MGSSQPIHRELQMVQPEETDFHVQASSDGWLFLGHWGAVYVTPEAALIDLAEVIRDDNGFTEDVKAYRCAEKFKKNGQHKSIAWKLTIS